MIEPKVIPKAANAFDIEFVQWQGIEKGNVTVARLEISVDSGRLDTAELRILRREGHFSPFQIRDMDDYSKEQVLGKSHSIEIFLEKVRE